MLFFVKVLVFRKGGRVYSGGDGRVYSGSGQDLGKVLLLGKVVEYIVVMVEI